jgi:hypothetical protein
MSEAQGLESVMRECLETDVSQEEPPPAVMARLRKYGDNAHRFLQERIQSGQLSPTELARALRCIAAVNQEASVGRQIELLKTALPFAVSTDVHLREVATVGVVAGTRLIRILELNSQSAEVLETLRKQMVPTAEIRRAVSEAIDLGLNEELADEARIFLREDVPDA